MTGITSIVLGFCCAIFGIPVGLVAATTGIIGLVQLRDQPGEGRGLAIAGIACGATAVIMAVVLFVVGFGSAVTGM